MRLRYVDVFRKSIRVSPWLLNPLPTKRDAPVRGWGSFKKRVDEVEVAAKERSRSTSQCSENLVCIVVQDRLTSWKDSYRLVHRALLLVITWSRSNASQL